MEKKKIINVTETFLPPIEEYQRILQRAWDKKWITNRGELVSELENKIKSKFNLSNLILTTNGTLPLQISIKALGLTGEIITTPFSYIATSSSIVWEGCTPVFSDIDKETFNIDPNLIESNITANTVAIIATHVFGNPCEIEKINTIAKKHNLKVIYDASHAFGTNYMGKSIFEFGDISTCSFHATKIFHTAEGGAMFSNNYDLYSKLFYHHNFGHEGKEGFHGLGINAKMSELQAAMGLSVFPFFDKILDRRKTLYRLYREKLKHSVTFQKINSNTDYNHAYIPIVFKSEIELQTCNVKLIKNNIFPRRYFYPSLNTVEYLNGKEMSISESISKKILCLPLYHDLKEEEVIKISELILTTLNGFK